MAGLLVAAAALILFGTGCNEELLPQDDIDIPFSMYGVITPQLDTQSVRIYPVEPLLTTQSADAVNDIRVTSTHLETGETLTWEDTVLFEPDGRPEFIYSAPFRAEYGASYRIQAERPSDGAQTYAEVRVPSRLNVEIVDPRPQSFRVALRGKDISMFRPSVEYLVSLPVPELPVFSYPISYEGREVRVDGGWELVIRLAEDRIFVQSRYNQDAGTLVGTRCDTLWLRRLTLDVVVGHEEWYPPGGRFDRNALSQAGTMSNVENGLGFIGAGYRIRDQIFLSRQTVEGACYMYYQ